MSSESRGGRSRHHRGRGQRGTTPMRAKGGRQKGLGGGQVEGRQAVRELLLAGTRSVQGVVIANDLDPAPILDDIIDLADEVRVPIRELSRSRFESMTHTASSQGVLALAGPLPEHDLQDLLITNEVSPVPFLLVLDSVTDPGNLGTILRSAECAGVTGVVLPRHRTARVTATVAKAAAGAIEYLQFASVSGVPSALDRFSTAGVWSVGLEAGGSVAIHELAVIDQPVALVLGSEGRGLSRLVRERCDVLAHVPLLGNLGSLNVGAAAAVALFEVARRRELG